MPVISTFGALSSRGFGGVGGKPTSFTYNYMGVPTVGFLYDFVTDSTGNYIGIFETDGITSIIKYNNFGDFILGKRILATLIPTTYVNTTCLTIDNSDNVYLGGNDAQIIKLDNNLNMIWSASYSNITGNITSISLGTNIAGTSERVYASNGTKLLSLQTDGTIDNIINGVGAKASNVFGWTTGSPSVNYTGSAIYSNDGLGCSIYPYGPWNYNTPYTSVPITKYNLSSTSFPFNFTDGIYTFRITSISSVTSNSTVTSFYNNGIGGFDIMYSFTAVWVSGGTSQPTRYYVGIRRQLLATVFGFLTALDSSTSSPNLYAWYYTNIINQPVNLASTGVGTTDIYGCYKSNGSTVIFKYISSSNSLVWCNKLTPSTGDGFETNRIRIASAGSNLKVYIEGTDGFFVLPADGSIPGSGNYTVNGINYTYTTVTEITPVIGPFLPPTINTESQRVIGTSTKSIITATTQDYIPPIVIKSLR